MIKRVISIALALMLVVACMAGVVSADEGYTANLGYANSDWSAQEWGENANTTVTGAGEYSVSWDGAGTDALVFVVDVVGAAADFQAAGIELTSLTVLADGVEVPVDLSKVVTGDLEEKGNWRIEIYNEYGSTKDNAPIDPAAVAFASNLTVNFTLGVGTGESAGYTANLGYANSDWSAQEWGENANTTVTGAGDYSVSWDGAGTDALVFVVDVVGAAADFQAAGLELTALSVLVDGVEVPVDLSKVVTGDLEEKGNWRIEIYNEYGSTKENAPLDPAAVAFASNLTVNFSLGVAEAPATEFAATLGFANADWSAQEWGENANTVVTGDGTYTLSWDGAASDALVFVVDLAGAQAALGESKTYELTALTVTVDGTELPVDLSKVVTGDIEEKGNWRIEIYNEYGSTKENPPVDPATVTFASNLTVTFTIATVDVAVDVEPTEPVETEPALEFDPNGTYNGYLLLQTPNWTYRDAWNSTNGIGSDYWGNFIYGNETSETYGVVTDCVIAGNGTYSVKITDFGTIFADDFAAAGQDYFNILGVTTDIPLNDQIVITDVKLIIDGSSKHTYKEAYLNPDDVDYIQIGVQNKWNDDIAELNYYPAPTTSLEIQFTVSGFAYDNADQAVDSEPTEGKTDDNSGDSNTNTGDTNTGDNDSGSILPIVIAVVVVAAVVVVVVVVLKKKKAN